MNEIRPIHYKIHLEPDLAKFQFTGKLELLLEVPAPASGVSLNILDLAIWKCELMAQGKGEACVFSVDPQKEELRILFPRQVSGEVSLIIDYVGEINNRMSGFYRSRYVRDGKERYAAVTQFEESDARRAFPCFDHPRMKATFEVEMLIDGGLTAISNTAVVEEKPLEDGRKLVRFERTPKMSTYLVFFGAGEFEFIQDPGEVLIRVAAVPGKAVQGKYSLEFLRKALTFCEEYYGIKYPLSKLDLIAIADFAFGAMENWGAITFRENLVLHDPDKTSKAGEERMCVVIAHELAHQWFGNLVTPEDWKYLWLNESFATFFGYEVVDHYYPGWDLWEQFLQGQTEVALDRDALHETFAIEIPGGDHVVINASTAPIIYNKGGSVLRQVEGYVGKEAFREGLRLYLRKYQYRCASSRDLWEALEEVSEKPVSKMMSNWIEQPGFPMVTVEREGGNLHVTQERFTYMPGPSDQEWLIPISVRVFYGDGQSKGMTTLLDAKSAILDMGAGAVAYKLNDGQSGFYRVRYRDKDNLKELGKQVASRALPSVDRWGIQDDLYAMVKRGEAKTEDYLDFLPHYSEEDASLPLSSIAANLHQAFILREGDSRQRIASVGRTLFERVLENIGYEPGRKDKHTTSILRDQILWQAALYGSTKAEEFCMTQFSLLLKDKKVHPDISKSVLQVGASLGNRETFEWFVEKIKSSESEHERMNMLVAIGCFKDWEVLKRVQRYVLEEVPDRNKFIPISVMSENLNAIPFLWDWYRSNLAVLERFHPIHYERVIAALVPICGLGREEEVRGFFQEYMKKQEKLKDVVKLSLERLEIHSRMRRS
jgi:tricorn protease interacting factor F2/3